MVLKILLIILYICGNNLVMEHDTHAEVPENIFISDEAEVIVYGKLEIDLDDCHIVNKEELGEKTIYYGTYPYSNPDKERSFRIEIEEVYGINVYDMETARLFFNNQDCYKMNIYQSFENKKGITEVYEAYAGEQSYLIKCKGKYYYIKTDFNRLPDLLYHWDKEAYLVQSYDYEPADEKNHVYTELTSNIYPQENKAVYKILPYHSNETFCAQLEITQGKYSDKNFSFTLYNEKGENIQNLTWKYPETEYPEFEDWNMDGYADMLISEWTDEKGLIETLFIWNEDMQCFQKVIYNGRLVYLDKSYGEIRNYNEDEKGLFYEVLTWDGNRLVFTERVDYGVEE